MFNKNRIIVYYVFNCKVRVGVKKRKKTLMKEELVRTLTESKLVMYTKSLKNVHCLEPAVVFLGIHLKETIKGLNKELTIRAFSTMSSEKLEITLLSNDKGILLSHAMVTYLYI